MLLWLWTAMPKKVSNAKIACLDFSLQKAKMKLGVQVLVENPEKLEAIRQRQDLILIMCCYVKFITNYRWFAMNVKLDTNNIICFHFYPRNWPLITFWENKLPKHKHYCSMCIFRLNDYGLFYYVTGNVISRRNVYRKYSLLELMSFWSQGALMIFASSIL